MSLKKYKRVSTVAKKTHKQLQKIAKSMGYNPDHIILLNPDVGDIEGYGRCWQIIWEEGPFEWAPSISAGESVCAFEMRSYKGEAAIPGLVYHPTVLAEPWNNYVLCFYEN